MDLLTPTLTVLEHVAGPAIVTSVVQLIKKRKKSKLNKICDEIVTSEIVKIRSSKGKETPTLYDISLRLSAKTRGSNLENGATLLVGDVLIKMFDQISDIPSFPNKHEVLKQIKIQIKLWFDITPPPTKNFLGLKKKQRKLTEQQVKLLQPNSKSKRFLNECNYYTDISGHVDLTIEVNDKEFNYSEKMSNKLSHTVKEKEGVVVSGPIPLSVIQESKSKTKRLTKAIPLLKGKGFQDVVKRHGGKEKLVGFKEKALEDSQQVKEVLKNKQSVYDIHYKYKVESFDTFILYQAIVSGLLISIISTSVFIVSDTSYLLFMAIILAIPMILTFVETKYIFNRLKDKRRIKSKLDKCLLLKKYEVGINELIKDNTNLLYFKDKRSYLDYKDIIFLKSQNRLFSLYFIIQEKELFKDLRVGSKVIVSDFALKKYILYFNKDLQVIQLSKELH